MKYSIKNEIKYFWKCSENNWLDTFDFNRFFWEFKLRLQKKLACHGQLSFEEYLSNIKKYYRISDLKKYIYSGKHSEYKETFEDILKNLFRKRYLYFRRKYSKNKKYIKLYDLYRSLQNQNRTRTDEVLLADRCIHAEHNSGHLFNLNIEKIRKEYELR